jgi:hypothetical protein
VRPTNRALFRVASSDRFTDAGRNGQSPCRWRALTPFGEPDAPYPLAPGIARRTTADHRGVDLPPPEGRTSPPL